ncbi:MAG: molecular chaperone DnaJ, partial [Chloroflexales bacterium]|nr:molecular chaperone DnaJ [Chloroflexales bacterium]
MNDTFSSLLGRLAGATQPIDVFGALGGDTARALKQRYRQLAAMAHPDSNPGRAAESQAAFHELHHWHALAQRQIAQGSYGRAPRISIATPQATYTGYAAPIGGDLCDLFPAESGERMLIKVARSPHNNDLLAAEASALQRIARELAGQPVRAHFPTLVEPVMLRDDGGAQRRANVLRAEHEYVSLADVIAAYPQGIHPADAAWMFNRVLTALASAHNAGLIHGALLPPHVLIRLHDHNGVLIDWCYSVEPGDAIKAISRPHAAHYPPEVAAKQPATPATDTYMAAALLARLLGGDAAGQGLPPSVPRSLV